MVMEGEQIRIALEDSFTSINHSFGGFFLGSAISQRLEGRDRGGVIALLCHEWFEVFPKSSNSIGNSEGKSTAPSSNARGSGESFSVKSMGGEGMGWVRLKTPHCLTWLSLGGVSILHGRTVIF